jgi:hypothetical protein
MYFKTEFETYVRPTDLLVVMNCKWFCTLEIPVCTVEPELGRGCILGVLLHTNGSLIRYVFHTQT